MKGLHLHGWMQGSNAIHSCLCPSSTKGDPATPTEAQHADAPGASQAITVCPQIGQQLPADDWLDVLCWAPKHRIEHGRPREGHVVRSILGPILVPSWGCIRNDLSLILIGLYYKKNVKLYPTRTQNRSTRSSLQCTRPTPSRQGPPSGRIRPEKTVSARD